MLNVAREAGSLSHEACGATCFQMGYAAFFSRSNECVIGAAGFLPGAERGEFVEAGFEDAFADAGFVEESFRGLHDWVRVEPVLHHVVVKNVGDGQKRHALMMRQPNVGAKLPRLVPNESRFKFVAQG
ncbi:MAG TPA: hypothetical protein VGR47_07480 [Terracidiphilus sp.]|nr:hypothetical protein [Terracidiphilus sp.]